MTHLTTSKQLMSIFSKHIQIFVTNTRPRSIRKKIQKEKSLEWTRLVTCHTRPYYICLDTFSYEKYLHKDRPIYSRMLLICICSAKYEILSQTIFKYRHFMPVVLTQSLASQVRGKKQNFRQSGAANV